MPALLVLRLPAPTLQRCAHRSSPPDVSALLQWRELGPDADTAHPLDGSPGEHLLPWFFAFGAGTCVHA